MKKNEKNINPLKLETLWKTLMTNEENEVMISAKCACRACSYL